MHSKYLYIGGAVVGLYLFSKLFGSKKKPTLADLDPSIIYLVDEKLDHVFSLKDLVAPKINAFDKPFEVCKKIDAVPKDQHIKLILCTNGGALSSCEKILKKLKSHPAGYTAYIKNECFSAGTILALGAKEIVMKSDSYLGKIDPQIASSSDGTYPAIIYHNLPENCITDHTIANVRISKQVLNYTEEILDIIFGKENSVRNRVKETMIYSDLPHSKTFDVKSCNDMGLSIREPTQDELKLFDNY
ncbi:peptidase S49 serine-peptidase [Fadolivirus algeromassiliense]|jgi:hypothetical protein|uniref:Peptidase S49 serine-peptidase n=1 Tax=Fadolivirus FV1/VV64 TaxID=3070911 RepID=A0A7D3V5W2_9VIRU|nr:peptidase S49 serine-peptidase [Fadolivirus algeromassiliense]QKF94575.1 peptidase S49 serine-peptidase [Fadolivirus FV1/VV64]